MSSVASDSKPNKSINIREEIARVIDIEIEGLQAVRDGLTAEFEQAVEAIASCRGQILVTGVGKSGLIASKIAATFRSTGTPSTFLHAGEALHGDIGVVRPDDIVMALGKSGESTELNELLRALKKNGNLIISLTANASSSMAQLSDYVLDLKITREACPLNLAPTTSTTAALAVGDAIAVTLMKIKNVSAEDFARHHPGGQLGKRLLLTVADVMRTGDRNPIIIGDRSIKEMLVTMTAGQAGVVSIVNVGGEFIGIVTDHDIRKALESDRELFSLRITDIMNANPTIISQEAKAIEALEMMRRRPKPLNVLPVLDAQTRVVGLVHIQDLISAGL